MDLQQIFEEMKKSEVLNLEKISPEQLKIEGGAYNQREWDKIIDRYMQYKGCQFYVARKQRGYEYDRYYAVYEIPEGIKLLNEVSYHSSITNHGFCRVSINEDGVVRRFLFQDASGKEGYAENCKENRIRFAKSSQEFGSIFTNIL